MKRAILITAAACLAALALASPASAAFGLKSVDLSLREADGSLATEAGSHPFSVVSGIEMNTSMDGEGKEAPDGALRDLEVTLPSGMAGIPEGTPRCSTVDFGSIDPKATPVPRPECSDATAIGYIYVRGDFYPALPEAVATGGVPVYNLVPPPGSVAKFGFIFLGVPVSFDVGLSEEPPYRVVVSQRRAPQSILVYGADLTLWGDPAAEAHDIYRGSCLLGIEADGTPVSQGTCAVGRSNPAFLTLPTACDGPLETDFLADSWQSPGSWVKKSALTHDDGEPPAPVGLSECGALGFAPQVKAAASTAAAASGTGLDFDVRFDDPGISDPEGTSQSTVKATRIVLPEGMTINPSVAEGLAFCYPDQLDRERASSAPGEGCPEAAKVGSLEVDSPLIEQTFQGSIYLAAQDDPARPGRENPFDSLIALYFVIKNAQLGVNVVLAAEVSPDPRTGQLITTLEDLPQIPFSRFHAHLRTGERAALITPPRCGAYEARAEFTPWARPAQQTPVSSTIEIDSGPGGGACPPGGVPPFEPGFQAGSINNNAGSFSPFEMRLTRADGNQDMTRFSAKLPPGVLGSLAGVGRCPDSAVGAAEAKSGREEQAAPSCPADSEIGHTLAGAGVGEALTYVPGSLYLAGPYNGAPLSVIAITPAVAGPFDAGTVVVREALTLNPKTAEVEVDGSASDPIPHILKGIPLNLRDLRVSVDRPDFTLNPTSCAEQSTTATLFGSYLDLLDPADDHPVELKARYQAAGCAALGFAPRLGLRLRGGTRRGAFPALRAVYRPRAGQANLRDLVVRLPRSAFLEQGHIRTICTRVQFAADACPKGARYGYIKAWTPLLDEPLQGPVYLRSSNHNLPDLVFDLRGLVDVEVATRIDSVKGGIRARVEDAPDAPISKVILRMQGAKKGLIVNSRNLCANRSRANLLGVGQNGRRFKRKVPMRASCKRGHRKRQRGHARAGSGG